MPSTDSDVKELRDQFNSQVDRLTKEERRDYDQLLREFGQTDDPEVREGIRQAMFELFAPPEYFGVNRTATLDDWIAADPDLKTGMSELEAAKKAFAKQVKQILAAKGLTQANLAQRLNVTQPTVAAWLSGNHKPQSKTLSKLADALQVPVETLWARPTEESVTDARNLIPHQGETFVSQTIHLSNHAYVRCTFERCTLVYTDGDFLFAENRLGSCNWRVECNLPFHDQQARSRLRQLLDSLDNAPDQNMVFKESQ